MPRRGGRVFNWVDDIAFETYLFKYRLSWVTFLSAFPLVFIAFGVGQLFSFPVVAGYAGVAFLLWFRLLVRPLNKTDPHGYCSELVNTRGLIRALAHRKSHPELPGNRVQSD
ncbi:hypothetical protein [Corynebacterium sp. AOP12-C2-36]|uniref:hypothetical protein n=1 Tax=Corynebacterium sp. AOP12-C2-36 TaxID=3457723 RepID=UPI004033318D